MLNTIQKSYLLKKKIQKERNKERKEKKSKKKFFSFNLSANSERAPKSIANEARNGYMLQFFCILLGLSPINQCQNEVSHGSSSSFILYPNPDLVT